MKLTYRQHIDNRVGPSADSVENYAQFIMQEMLKFMSWCGLETCQWTAHFGNVEIHASSDRGNNRLTMIPMPTIPTAEEIVTAWSAAMQLVYYDVTGTQLKFAYSDGSSWITEVIDEDAVACTPCLALDNNGYPHVLYVNTSSELIYAVRGDGSWTKYVAASDPSTAYITENPPTYSLALDSNDSPAIAYHDTTISGGVGDWHIHYLYGWNGSSFASRNNSICCDILGPTCGNYLGIRNSLNFNSSDQPIVAYYDTTVTNRYMRTGIKTGGSWGSRVNHPSVHNLNYVNGPLQHLDSNSYECVSYIKYHVAHLGNCDSFRSNQFNGTAWSTADEKIHEGGTIPDLRLFSMWLDSSDYRWFIYEDTTNSKLMISYYDGSTTKEEVLTTLVNWATGDENSGGDQVIVWSETGGALKWKKRTGAATFTTAETIDSGNTNYCVLKCVA